MSQPPEVRIQINEHSNATPTSGPPRGQRQPERIYFAGLKINENNVLLIVATLITTLTYQVGTNLPRGYYQDDNNDHYAGDSILRHKEPHRYWLFVIASWGGFINSMLLTLALLTGVSVESRLVQWPFVVAYSSLVLTFITSLPRIRLLYGILLWMDFLFVLWAAIHFIKQLENTVRKATGALKYLVSRLFLLLISLFPVPRWPINYRELVCCLIPCPCPCKPG